METPADFDPMRPGGRLVDYAAFVMAQPDVPQEMPLTVLLRYLKTRTAVSSDELEVNHLLLAVLNDRRFEWSPNGRRRWSLAVPYRVQSGKAAPRPADRSFDPNARGGQLADYAAFVMGAQDVHGPVLLSTVGSLLRTRTAALARDTTVPALREALTADPRFTQVDERLWVLVPQKHRGAARESKTEVESRPARLPAGHTTTEYITELLSAPDFRRPVSVKELIEVLPQRTNVSTDDLRYSALHPALLADSRFYRIRPGKWVMATAEPGEPAAGTRWEWTGRQKARAEPVVPEPFDPMVPGSELAEYAYWVMSQPDVETPMLFSTVLTLLMTRTAVTLPRNRKEALAVALMHDRRFQQVKGYYWALRPPPVRASEPDLRTVSPQNLRIETGAVQPLGSVSNYIVELLQEFEIRQPIGVYQMIDLLRKRSDIGPHPWKFKTVHSALVRDTRFYRVDRGLWRMHEWDDHQDVSG